MKKILAALLSIVLSTTLLSACSLFDNKKSSSESTSSTDTSSSINENSSSTSNYAGEFDNSKYVSIPFTRQNCKTDNGYDYHISGSTSDLHTHKRFQELVSLRMEGVKKANDIYSTISNTPIKCIFTLNENPENLPRHNEAGWWNWYVNNLSNDTYAGPVYGTSIDGNQIGRGAVYFAINYTDGTSDEFFECNFLNGMDKGSTKSYNIPLDVNKQISTIDVVVVYELYYEYYTNLIDFEKRRSNWRLSASLSFV